MRGQSRSGLRIIELYIPFFLYNIFFNHLFLPPLTRALAEFERDIIRERTMAGLQAARARGRIGDRPKVMDERKINLPRHLMKDPTNNANEVAKTLGVSRATLYRYL
jgi:transcriptional regulator of acetoin/glycerol metabolism